MQPGDGRVRVIITCPRNAIIAVVALAVLAIAGCGEMDAEADPRLQVGADPEGRILFVKNGDVHLWDGSTEQLTEFGDASSPSWSSNGEQYLFVRTGDAFSDLMLGNATNRQWRNLTENEPNAVPGTQEYLSQVVWVIDPVWSPSGNGISYASDRGATTRNFLWYQSGLDSNDAWRVPCSTRYNENVERPHFSPDGSQVVFAQRTSTTRDLERWMELRICDLNTDELTELVTGEPHDAAFFPRWSPDGDWIVYVRQLEEQSDLWVVPAEGGEPVQLTELGDVTGPEWSPDGRHIAFFDRDGDGFKVAYIEFEVEPNGTISVSDPSELFSASNIHAPSGLSWSD
jgi:TolB protein